MLLLAAPVFGLDKGHPWEGVAECPECSESQPVVIPNTYWGTKITLVSFAALNCRSSGGILICRWDGNPNWLCECEYKNLK